MSAEHVSPNSSDLAVPCGPATQAPAASPAQILILYDPFSTHVNTTVEHLKSFGSYSRNRCFYYPVVQDRKCTIDFSRYDVLVLHYSIRVSERDNLSRSFAEKVRSHKGLKILFMQDEYENTSVAIDWMTYLGLDVLFACVPTEHVEKIFSKEKLPEVHYEQTLTGFVPSELEHLPKGKPFSEREFFIGYRGRQIGFWYGRSGHEKVEIGRRMRAICEEKGIRTDIEWTEDKRIYRQDWYAFLGNCRASLGTETGSNVFDFDGKLKAASLAYQRKHPDATFEEVFERLLEPYEGLVPMGQVSPKHFEAIALRTALILFEGKYSGILEPERHYIPLRKDFANVEEVLERLNDEDYLFELTERAHREIIQSGRYSYRAFIRHFDGVLAKQLTTSNCQELLLTIVGWRKRRTGCEAKPGGEEAVLYNNDPFQTSFYSEPYVPLYDHRPVRLTVFGVPIPDFLKGCLEFIWKCTPRFVRNPARSVLLRVFGT